MIICYLSFIFSNVVLSLLCPIVSGLNPLVTISSVIMAVQNGRALHFVFKIADRTATAKFYQSILGMKVNFSLFVIVH